MPGERMKDAGLTLPEKMYGTMFEWLPYSHQDLTLIKQWMTRSQCLLPFSHFSDICKIILLKCLLNMLKFIINCQVKLFHWKIFDCRNIFKLLESIPIGTDSIAISRIYYWYIFAKFILTFKIFPICIYKSSVK